MCINLNSYSQRLEFGMGKTHDKMDQMVDGAINDAERFNAPDDIKSKVNDIAKSIKDDMDLIGVKLREMEELLIPYMDTSNDDDWDQND